VARDGLARVARRLPLVVAMDTRARAPWVAGASITGFTLVDPLNYLDFLAHEAGAALVPTDSGGAQEETTVLGVSCLTLRAIPSAPSRLPKAPAAS
jgi:UDP-N-acetylglucosamine 2-epimerase (non-hydrolysing)